MRKHNEGYALVLVLVVLVVMCLLSATILAGAQRNLTGQMNAVKYMQNKFEAQGKIEQIVGALESLPADAEEFNIKIGAALEKASEEEEIPTANIVTDENTTVSVTLPEEEGRPLKIQVTSKSGNVQIDCLLLVECEDAEYVNGVYEVLYPHGLRYSSFEISRIGGGT